MQQSAESAIGVLRNALGLTNPVSSVQISCSMQQSKSSPLKEAQSAIGVPRNALDLTSPCSSVVKVNFLRSPHVNRHKVQWGCSEMPLIILTPCETGRRVGGPLEVEVQSTN